MFPNSVFYGFFLKLYLLDQRKSTYCCQFDRNLELFSTYINLMKLFWIWKNLEALTIGKTKNIFQFLSYSSAILNHAHSRVAVHGGRMTLLTGATLVRAGFLIYFVMVHLTGSKLWLTPKEMLQEKFSYCVFVYIISLNHKLWQYYHWQKDNFLKWSFVYNLLCALNTTNIMCMNR